VLPLGHFFDGGTKRTSHMFEEVHVEHDQPVTDNGCTESDIHLCTTNINTITIQDEREREEGRTHSLLVHSGILFFFAQIRVVLDEVEHLTIKRLVHNQGGDILPGHLRGDCEERHELPQVGSVVLVAGLLVFEEPLHALLALLG